MPTDPFHESDLMCQMVVREYTETNSISMMTAYGAHHAVEEGLKVVYRHATGVAFPFKTQNVFKSHDPEQWLVKLGIKGHLSKDAQHAIDEFKNWKLSKVRYSDEAAHRQHVAPLSASRGKFIAEKLPLVLQEFRRIDTDSTVRQLIVSNIPK